MHYPLTYSDPDGEFFGYEHNGLKTLDGWNQPGMKALVGGVTLTASTLVGIRKAVAIVQSADSVTVYQAMIGDTWAPWIVDLYRQAKRRWSYQIPPNPTERRVIRDLCVRTLAFENLYLLACRDYLEAEARQADPERRRLAAKRLSKAVFRGPSDGTP